MRFANLKYLAGGILLLPAIALFILPTIFGTVSLPTEIEDIESIQSFQITDRNGVPLMEMLSAQNGRGRRVSFEEISPNLINATVVAEDKRFFIHLGVDPLAIIRSAFLNIKEMKIVGGASTLTQQLARMLRPGKRTFIRKLTEAIIATRIELSLSKKEILEQYLNRAPYGNQLFGCEAASQMYFGKPSLDLTVAEAAYLAILPRAPSAFSPYKDPGKIGRLHKQLINELFNLHKINSDERDAALTMSIKLVEKKYAFSAPHFAQMLPKPAAPGNTVTSLDMRLQSRVDEIIKNNLSILKKYNVTNAAAIIIENKTGEILSLVGSGEYENETIAGNVNGATSPRQPGSALKPFTYALALELGFTAASIIPDIELHFPTEHGDYIPRNYDLKFRGPVRLRNALVNSLNVPAVHIASKIGVANILSKLHELGFASLTKNPEYYGLGLTLGNGEVTLLELANAYSVLARSGGFIPLRFYPIMSGERIDKPKKIFSEETAYIISDILSDDESRRMSFGEDTPLNLPFRVAAKTGTSKNFRDNWTIGYTPEITVGVWVGNFNGSPMRGISGITGAGPIFREIFISASENRDMSWFAKPKNIIHKEVCPLSGAVASKKCATKVDEIFINGTEPQKECLFHFERLIDKRTNLLAGDDCDERFTSLRSFINLPNEYYEWAVDHNVNMLPSGFSPLCPPKDKVLATATPETNGIAKARITHPNNNTSYFIDHNIPLRLQNLYLRASGEGELSWTLDGNEFAKTNAPHSASWQLTEGTHTFAIRTSNGHKDQITINVIK